MQLVISDAHTGLKAAIGAVLIGAAWQRCRVHFMRNVLAEVPKGNQEMVAAAIRTIFAQPDAEHVHEQFEIIAAMLGQQLPKVEQMLRDAQDDLLAFTGFPPRTGGRSGRPTRSSGSTGRSNAAPTSSASSPTPPRCSAWPAPSWSRPTTNGRSPPNAATSPKLHGPAHRDQDDEEVAKPELMTA